uniref:Uncharacterized protein n=1 Tax=Sphaerodactylus townsendi TaxID=933632 RepID=A0ACB8G3N6_9SAUR
MNPFNVSFPFVGNSSLDFFRARDHMKSDYTVVARVYHYLLPEYLPFLLLLVFLACTTGGRMSLLTVYGMLRVIYHITYCLDKMPGDKAPPLSKSCVPNGGSCLSISDLFSMVVEDLGEASQVAG